MMSLSQDILTVLYNRDEPKLSSHLWILGKLLDLKSDFIAVQLERFYIYILSFCCRKMNCWFKSVKSQPYIRALTELKGYMFLDLPIKETLTKTSNDCHDYKGRDHQ